MSLRSLRGVAAVLFAFAVCVTGARASAQVPCSSCEQCTTALASANANVQLGGDLRVEGAGPCITVAGEHARLDGGEHLLRAANGATAIRVTGASALVRNVHVAGGEVGVEVVSARGVTLFHDTFETRGTAVRVQSSGDLRVVRARVTGGRVGVAFGADNRGACQGPMNVQSPGAVLIGSSITGTDVGVAACDALPVLTGNTVTRNGVGVLLGDPSARPGPGGDAPFDSCTCAPTLSGVRAGTLLMFSSGCGGCLVHEGWLPELRRRRADIRLRETGATARDAQDTFDRFAEHCIPAVIDALGIPGCVPNYGCMSTGQTAKTRGVANALQVERSLDSPDAVAAFATECTRSAQGRFVRGARCVTRGLEGNTICNNRTMDIRASGNARRIGGGGNHCDHAENWGDGSATGCAASCSDTSTPVVSAPPDTPEMPEMPEAPPAPAPPPVSVATAPVMPPAPAPTATPAPEASAGASSPLGWVLGITGLSLAAAGGMAWRGRRRIPAK
jgi:hypothetical protein